jgi:hypothetical protein
LWRNTNLAPDLTFDAPVMEAMFTAKTGLPVDGVIQIDPAGLGAMLQGTGPVDVAGLGSVTADNVVDLTINRTYIDVPNRDQRQELLGDVARSAFDSLVNGTFSSLRPFGDALFKSAQQRHLIFSPNDAGVRQDVAFFKADGALPAPDLHDYALLTVQNFSKNKLDYYVDSTLDLTGSRPGADFGELVAAITVTNTLPSSVTSSYVIGPNAPGEAKGLYRAEVSLYLPNGASLVDASGSERPPVLTTEAGRTVAVFDVAVGPGATASVQLRLALAPRPKGAYSLRLVPVARVRPTVVSVDIDDGSGHHITRAAAPLTRPEAVSRPR